MSLAEARQELARQQENLLRSLTGCGPTLKGVPRLDATAAALMTKRLRAVARAWPALVRSLGDEFEPRFRAFAHRTPLPKAGGPLADGRAFARELHDRSDEARLELLLVDLHWKQHADGLVVRRGPAVRGSLLRESARLVIGVRFPWLGEYWVSLHWPLPLTRRRSASGSQGPSDPPGQANRAWPGGSFFTGNTTHRAKHPTSAASSRCRHSC